MIYAFGPFELDRDRFELRRAGVTVAIEPKVLSLLFLLVQERRRAVEKRELLTKNWPDTLVGEGSLARAVMEARKAIGDDAHTMIVTVRGRGVRFAAPVVERGVERGAVIAPLSETTASALEMPGGGLVGRTTALMALEARLTAAALGRGCAVWITGEAGIGKSAVVDEIARIATRRGANVLRARCHEHESPPYWPWTQIAREASRVAAHAEIAALDPTLEGAERFAAFDRFTRDLRVVAATAFLYIVLEDVHWADRASLLMLQFVVREIVDAPILLAVTYRDSPPVAGPCGEALEAAVHASGAVSVPLRALGKDDVKVLLERATNASPTAAVVARLHAKTGGNPLYLRELLQASEGDAETLTKPPVTMMTSRSTELSTGLRASIERHLDAISAPCRETLSLAALLGPSFDVATLIAVATSTGASSEAIVDRLSEAVAARLVEKSAGAYQFRHALVRSVLSRSLSGTERATAHAAIAIALEARWGAAVDAHAEELAHHYVRALPYGDPRRALDTSVQAAEAATTRGAFDRAQLHYHHAIEALRHLNGEEARTIALHLALAAALERTSMDDARAAYLDAAVLARALGRADDLAIASLAFASTDANREAARALLEQARDALHAAPNDSSPSLERQIEDALAAIGTFAAKL